MLYIQLGLNTAPLIPGNREDLKILPEPQVSAYFSHAPCTVLECARLWEVPELHPQEALG